jgi:Membrane fusion protein Use1
VIQLERSEGPGKPDSYDSSNYQLIILRTAIAQQRKRIMNLHNQVTHAQQQLPITEEIEDEEEPATTTPPVNDITNEPTAVLRNRLFTNNREEEKDTSTEHVLQHHRMLQDDLSNSMLGMARGLKERSIAFGEALKEDSKVYISYFMD